jgi:hypothetical protein
LTNGDHHTNGNDFLERAKFFRDHVQTVLSLATGALVLSVTFIHDLAPEPQHIGRLRASWLLFVVCILLGLMYNYLLAIVADKANDYKILLDIISFFFHLTFLIALVYLTRFGLANLHPHIHPSPLT